jgi:hypothetical protein
MTFMLADIHDGDTQRLIEHRIPGAGFDEVLYADDTICMSMNTRAMNKLLASIEREGAKYGMKLNKSKCELVKTNKNPNVHFANGQRVPPKDEVKYLGCHLNKHCDTQKEVKSRIARCMTTLRKNIFSGGIVIARSNSNC